MILLNLILIKTQIQILASIKTAEKELILYTTIARVEENRTLYMQAGV